MCVLQIDPLHLACCCRRRRDVGPRVPIIEAYRQLQALSDILSRNDGSPVQRQRPQQIPLDPMIRLSKQTCIILAALAVQQAEPFHWSPAIQPHRVDEKAIRYVVKGFVRLENVRVRGFVRDAACMCFAPCACKCIS